MAPFGKNLESACMAIHHREAVRLDRICNEKAAAHEKAAPGSAARAAALIAWVAAENNLRDHMDNRPA